MYLMSSMGSYFHFHFGKGPVLISVDELLHETKNSCVLCVTQCLISLDLIVLDINLGV